MSSANDNYDDHAEVEKVIGKKSVNGRIQFLVKWKGYSYKDNEWVFADDCECDDLISDFESKDIMGILGNFCHFFVNISCAEFFFHAC